MGSSFHVPECPMNIMVITIRLHDTDLSPEVMLTRTTIPSVGIFKNDHHGCVLLSAIDTVIKF